MKKITCCLIMVILIFTCVLSAKSVEFGISEKVAENKLVQLGKANEFSISKSEVIFDQDNETVLFCLFELYPQGYIVTAADTDLPPVIAYSFTGSFYHEQSGNLLLNLLRNDLRLRLANISVLPQEIISARNNNWLQLLDETIELNRFEQWPPEGTTPTGGWLLENWTQSAPYNNFCPLDPVTGNRSVAGCPAIAMSQILNYHRSTNGVTFADSDDYYHNYAGRQYWIDDDYLLHDFLSFPQMNVCLDTLATHYLLGDQVTNADKAALVFACGVAAQQVYTSGVSGTFGVDQALQAYQKFNFTAGQLIDETTPDFYEQITQNIMDALPVHFASVTPAWDSGHNFVVDGYNTDEYYHINFGWGGPYNGWYLLPDEIPYGLTVVEGAIVDIIPVQITGYILSQIILTPAAADSSLIIVTAGNPAGEFSFSIQPDSSGTTAYLIEIPIGTYSVTASFPGYESISCDNVIVEEQQITQVDFHLSQIIPPTDLTGELNGNEILLNWQHPPGRELQYFNIYRNINSSVFTLLETTDQLSYVDYVDPPVSLTYGYHITAMYSQENESSGSNEVYLEYVVSAAGNDIITTTKLGNYPNPFNPSGAGHSPTTTIYFVTTSLRPGSIHDSTRQAADVKIVIYNLQGQKIRTFPVVPSQSHTFSVVWDGTDENNQPVASGIYLYKLDNGSHQLTRKMILLK